MPVSGTQLCTLLDGERRYMSVGAEIGGGPKRGEQFLEDLPVPLGRLDDACRWLGQGHGLMLVKEILTQHGFAFSLASAECGTQFRIEMAQCALTPIKRIAPS